MIEMQDHIAVITGAGSGFGEATAYRLAREGMPIFCQDINEENAQRTAAKVREGNGRAEAIGGDVASEADVKAMFAACRSAFGDCTLLFANAGYARLSPFVEMSVEEFDRMVAVLLRGVFLCDREALGPMLEKGEGVIINTASQLGHKGANEMAHYAAAKAGVIGLTKSLALEFRAAACGSTPSAPAPATPRSSTTSPRSGSRRRPPSCRSGASAKRGRSPRPWPSSPDPAGPSTPARPLGPTRAT